MSHAKINAGRFSVFKDRYSVLPYYKLLRLLAKSLFRIPARMYWLFKSLLSLLQGFLPFINFFVLHRFNFILRADMPLYRMHLSSLLWSQFFVCFSSKLSIQKTMIFCCSIQWCAERLLNLGV